jgi:hypothetical protein
LTGSGACIDPFPNFSLTGLPEIPIPSATKMKIGTRIHLL